MASHLCSSENYWTYANNPQGGGARYPYPKHVWSPAGGWWVRPSNWKSNTFIYALGVGVITYGVFQYSSQREVRILFPGSITFCLLI
ncbi:hypothetical protein Moror_9809 [Moniliophthora roreri MCA 2997]|uniref:Uncharacterized protein n=1 Tax=Moniliophthora roreri (strain MCA 2997) TaxID=1381753 RepID=V2WI60_MONRO|nr:hypothetical protein Moror_9809 [Moniliophthora roreri MCA 2997]